LAALVVVSATAAATAVAGLLQVSNLVHDLTFGNNGVKVKGITLPKPGAPQTILLIGSDHRSGLTSFKKSNTDTLLLVRLNAASSTINVMSIPRDLQVDVPGQAINPQKINAAYSEGGYGLLLKTIKQNVFPDLRVNHIVDTNFGGFSDLVDAIGCVYSDVDRRYYNVSAPGPNNYSSIDIEPGYQKLCGHNQSVSGALPFVRFRHTDTDIVREARQQDFIRWAKEQYPISKLVANRDRLLRILGKHSTLDKTLQSEDGILELFNLVLNADGSAIKQIPFPADLQPCTTTSCFVTSNQPLEQRAFARFMTPTAKAKGQRKQTATAKGHKRQSGFSTSGLAADLPDGRSQVAQLSKVTMPVYFPKFIKPSVNGASGTYCLAITGNCNSGSEPATEYAHSYPRQYLIRDQHGMTHAAYRMTLALDPVKGEFYGVQGVAWKRPPLLQSPSGTRTIKGRKLFLYADGGRLTTVAWHLGDDSYWISNTLTSDIPNGQMIAMAASMIRGRG
jgi:polyisoprenyl-teichoic acid--peptidoglycan teichoic acid transferase